MVVVELESSESCGLVKCYPDLGIQVRKSPCHCLGEVPYEPKPNKIPMCYKDMDSCKKYTKKDLTYYLCTAELLKWFGLCKVVLYKLSSCLSWHTSSGVCLWLYAYLMMKLLLSNLSLNLFCCNNDIIHYSPWKLGKVAFLLSFGGGSVEIVSITILSVLLVTPSSTVKSGSHYSCVDEMGLHRGKSCFCHRLGREDSSSFPSLL